MELSYLIDDLTRSLMRKVCIEVGPALGRRPDLRISFNFAGKLFSEPSIVKDVRDIFVSSPIIFSQVVLEVTERDPIENFTETRQTIADLQGLGVCIAIDDVGIGHSHLSYISRNSSRCGPTAPTSPRRTASYCTPRWTRAPRRM